MKRTTASKLPMKRTPRGKPDITVPVGAVVELHKGTFGHIKVFGELRAGSVHIEWLDIANGGSVDTPSITANSVTLPVWDQPKP